MAESLIRLSEVQRRTGYSKAWLYRLMSEKRFPLPVKIGARSIAFIESEIDAWIEERINASRSATPSLNAGNSQHNGSTNACKSSSKSE
ncbi:AlpA family transcriptional regulator [Pantoea dispersa]|nr:AlpA family transcriptional regulator [Pantoea dispersa]